MQNAHAGSLEETSLGQECSRCWHVSGGGQGCLCPVLLLREVAAQVNLLPVSRPLQILGKDIMELPKSERGNQDFLTKWPFVFLMPYQKIIRIVKLLVENVIPMIGMPEAFLTDRGTNLLSHLMKRVCVAGD